ncbi:uncharacterized protein LOC122242591 [Penaeus japonicus]|uniref:uncharacterized protein LOC122242591 n=1 Tax=Penaeus japonicus TaxID=27405 RepID=UPI001C710CF1|nr:uncharacterized protein LOC122242591 [Penaeus japonicus]
MKLLILVFVTAVTAAPQGYNFPTPFLPSFHIGSCNYGQVRHVDGRCITPHVTQRVYFYDAPRTYPIVRQPYYIPEPKVERNVIFVRLPEDDQGPDPIIVPPPQQQQVVYVLNKQSEQDQRVIEVPAPPPTEPEVVFVNYEEGENPILPSGQDLHSALTSAAHGAGHVVGHSGIGGVGSISGIGHGIGGVGGIGGIGHGIGADIGGFIGSGVGSGYSTPSSLYNTP